MRMPILPKCGSVYGHLGLWCAVHRLSGDIGLPSPVLAWAKVVLSGLQANALAIGIFNWSDEMLSFLGLQQEVGSMGMAYFNIRCIFPALESLLC